MCKISGRAAKYNLIKGNIQQLVNQAILSMEGNVPPSTMNPPPSLHTPPLQPPAIGPLGSSAYSTHHGLPVSTWSYPSQQIQTSTPATVNVTRQQNNGHQDQVNQLANQLFLQWIQHNLSKSWLKNRLTMVEKYKGINHPETQAALQVLGNHHWNAGEWYKASGYYSRLLSTFQDKNSPKAREVLSKLNACIRMV
jgi:hypothetical protein